LTGGNAPHRDQASEHSRSASVTLDAAEVTGRDDVPGAGVYHFYIAHVEVVMQVALGTGAPGDRKHFGHREYVGDGGTERVRGGCGQVSGQHFSAAVDPPQPEVDGAQAYPAGRFDHLDQVARVGGQQRGLERADQVAYALGSWDQPEHVAGGPGQSAYADILLDRGRRPGADVDLHAVALEDLAPEQAGQRGQGVSLAAGLPL
jgi:hypothetical protein